MREQATMAGTVVCVSGGCGWAGGGVCRDELRRSASKVAAAVSFYMAPPQSSGRNAPASAIILAGTDRYYGGGTYGGNGGGTYGGNAGSSSGDHCKVQGFSNTVATTLPPLPLRHRGAQCSQRRPPQARRGAATHVGGGTTQMGKPLHQDEGGVAEGEHRRPGGAGRAGGRGLVQERRGAGGSWSRLPNAAGASPSVHT